MINLRLSFLLAFVTAAAIGQNDKVEEGKRTLQRALRSSTLTYEGQPFHAVMEIAPKLRNDSPSAGSTYTGRVEVWWASSSSYRIQMTSPSFTQNRVVSGGAVEETNTGNFLPSWLSSYVRVLIDPVPVALFNLDTGAFMMGGESGGFSTELCIRRDDRDNGITNEMTYGQVCFDPSNTKINSITTFNYGMYMEDWQSFQNKEIARSYDTFVEDELPLAGKLTTLEHLSSADQATIVVTKPTSTEDHIATAFVSTAKAESLLEKAPIIQWPSVREGKTEGYMIVYARTDKTGQVRETEPHSSDNPQLMEFGMKQALAYKFKPLVENGVVEQMEMPLVLHFSSRTENALPMLTVEQMKGQTIICKPARIPAGVLDAGERAIVRVSVDENGKTTGVQPASTAPWGKIVAAWTSVERCQFRPYKVNGKTTRYKGEVDLMAP